MKELYIGSHLSTAGGWSALLKRSHEEHGTTFAFFPRSPYGRPSKALNPSEAVAFARQLTAEHYGPSTTSPARIPTSASSPYGRSPRTSDC